MAAFRGQAHRRHRGEAAPPEEPICGDRDLHVRCPGLRRDPHLEAIRTRRARDHRRQQLVSSARAISSYEVLRGWWTDAGTFEALHRAGNLVAKTGANKLDAPRTARRGGSDDPGRPPEATDRAHGRPRLSDGSAEVRRCVLPDHQADDVHRGVSGRDQGVPLAPAPVGHVVLRARHGAGRALRSASRSRRPTARPTWS